MGHMGIGCGGGRELGNEPVIFIHPYRISVGDGVDRPQYSRRMLADFHGGRDLQHRDFVLLGGIE